MVTVNANGLCTKSSHPLIHTILEQMSGTTVAVMVETTDLHESAIA